MWPPRQQSINPKLLPPALIAVLVPLFAAHTFISAAFTFPPLTMDVLWMQNFLGLQQCEVQPCSSTASSNCAPLHCDDYDGDTDALFEFSCPFCYLEYDIGSLCSHLEEEHGAVSKSAVCPVCAVKTGPDIVGHITNQHGHLFRMQRRRRARKPSTSSSNSFPLDSLLTSLLNGLSASEFETSPSLGSKEAFVNSLTLDQKNISSGAGAVWKHDVEEAISRARFVQQMVLSTVFRED